MTFIEYINKQEIINKYNIISIEELTGGLVNKTYKIVSASRIYVAKVLNKYNTANVNKYELSEKIANVCNLNGINVCNAIKLNNKYVQTIGDDYVILYDYLTGESIDEKDITNEHIVKIANMVGRIHSIDYKENYNKVIRHSIDWSKFVKASDFDKVKYKELYLENYGKYKELFDKVIEYKNNKEVRLGICHRDIKSSNVIWHNNNPYLIDFESSRVDDTRLDFIETMLRWCGITTHNIDYDKIALFINEYKKYVDISNIDYSELLYANLLIRFDFLYYNLDITLIDKTNNTSVYNKACDEVINTINEINYYIDNIDNLIKYLSN